MGRVQPNHRRGVLTPAVEAEIESWSLETSTAPLFVEPRKETATVGFNFKMTPTNHAKLKRLAEHEDRSLQNLLNTIVWPAIAEKEGELGW